MVAGVAAALIVGGLATAMFVTRLPATYNMAETGYPDYGGGPQPAQDAHAGHHHGGADDPTGTSIATLVEHTDGRLPDVRVALTARAERVTLADGRQVDGYSLNGQTPGPTIEAVQGDLVEVTVTNSNVTAGITLHWHGMDVPNAEDGVAGVTQDAVLPGQSHTYVFVADQVGTYWYHSHQQSHPQVVGGLLGAVVVRPRAGLAQRLDVPAVVHFYDGVRTINGRAGETHVDAAPGTAARVRIVNTDGNLMPVWVSGSAYRVLAMDGTEVNAPTPITDASTIVTAGGRADLEVVAPADGSGVRVQMANASVVIGGRAAPTASAPNRTVDLLTYGTPTGPAIDPATADRTFEYAIGRAPGVLDGKPGFWWTIDGHLFPDVPMFMVAEGDLVVMHLTNTSGESHPMHLHGHHVTVLAHNNVKASGSPWTVDSLDVENGGDYLVAFRADNPGIWMDHCHNLPHASEGLMTHLAYIGYTTPFRIGGASANHPE